QHRLVDHRQNENQEVASITQPLRPHLFRHQMLTYLTSKSLTDAQIQLISGHESKESLEVYQHLSLESVDKAYQDAVQSVGIQRDFCGTLGTFVGLTPAKKPLGLGPDCAATHICNKSRNVPSLNHLCFRPGWN